VKAEVYRVATRYRLEVDLVCNSRMHVPDDALFRLVVVGSRLDEADDWIVERVTANDVVVTADVPLAARCIAKGARVLDPKGKVFTEDSVGDAVAHRDLMAHLRESGTITGGPAPFLPKDRSRFLERLDALVNAVRAGKR
jgi:uncharacterized protein